MNTKKVEVHRFEHFFELMGGEAVRMVMRYLIRKVHYESAGTEAI